VVRAHRLEDRIRELCAQAVSAQDSDLESIFSELQSALREHTERIRKLAAAKLTVWKPRGLGLTNTAYAWGAECAICNQSIPLEDSKVSEDGQPVHEECYVAKIIQSLARPTQSFAPATGIGAESERNP
jgi:hypothetical protein